MIDASVIITCFNKEPYLEEAINSVLEQSKHPKEIVVIHDGCSAPSHHPRVKTVILGNNVGVSQARNEGFRISQGKLILFLDGDDKLSPDFIEKSVLALTGKGVDIVYPNIFWKYENDEDNELVVVPEKITRKDLEKTCRIVVTSLMKREVMEKLGGFRDFPVFEDWDLWLRAMDFGFKLAKVDVLLTYRQLANNRNRQKKSVKEQVLKQIMKGNHAQS